MGDYKLYFYTGPGRTTEQVYEGPQISIDGAPRTVLSFVFLANRLTISIQTPDKAASAWGEQGLHKTLVSQEVLLFQPPPATVKLAFALPCFLHLFTPSTGTLTLRSWHTLTTKRPIDQTGNIQSMKTEEESYSQDLINTWKTEQHSKFVLLRFPFCHLTCLFIKC